MNKFKKKYLILSIPLIFTGVAFYIVTLPILNEIRSISKEFQSIKENQNFLHLQINEIKKFNQALDSYKPAFRRADEIFIDPQAPIDFINFLEKKPQELNISLQTSSISLPQIQSESLTEITFDVIIHGPFINFLKFLKTIENSHYLIVIEDIVISEMTERDAIRFGFNEPIIESSMSIKLFTK